MKELRELTDREKARYDGVEMLQNKLASAIKQYVFAAKKLDVEVTLTFSCGINRPDSNHDSVTALLTGSMDKMRQQLCNLLARTDDGHDVAHQTISFDKEGVEDDN